MTFFKWNIAAMLIGLALDLCIGDPEGWPHPVIWIGNFISSREKKLRMRSRNLRRSAVWLTASTVLLSMAATAAVLFVLYLIDEIALLIGMGLISWTCISAKCLAKEGRGVAQALELSLESRSGASSAATQTSSTRTRSSAPPWRLWPRTPPTA